MSIQSSPDATPESDETPAAIRRPVAHHAPVWVYLLGALTFVLLAASAYLPTWLTIQQIAHWEHEGARVYSRDGCYGFVLAAASYLDLSTDGWCPEPFAIDGRDLPLTDDNLAQLVRSFPELDSVSLNGTQVTATGWQTLIDKSPQWTRIMVTRASGMTSEQLQALRSLPHSPQVTWRGASFLGVASNPALGDDSVIWFVEPGSPADLGGIRSGDRLLQVDGRLLTTFESLAEYIGRQTPGEIVELRLERQGAPVELSIALGEYHD